MNDRKLNLISLEEKHKFNVTEQADDYRGTLRNCNRIYQECYGKSV